MRILADAHIGWLIVRHLESLGHDVLRAATLPPSTSDAEVLKRAVGEGRVILTSDKDFGELVFRLGLRAVGVVLLRIDVATETERLSVVQTFWPDIEQAVAGHFVTVTARRVRRIPLP
jgi:predicted nuclease of predicted toxin-antitoxin system